MMCSGCGKDIPFNGTVCPYCMRDKSNDKLYTVLAVVFGFIGGVSGYFLYGFWGILGGFVIGCVIAAFIALSGTTKPPEVQVVPPTKSKPTPPDPIASKLAKLKQLHDQGLLTSEEYARKKADILAKF